jgi:hypothetical protein
VRERAPRAREVHGLCLQQREPVIGQRRIAVVEGGVVVRETELGALTGQQVRAIACAEGVEHRGHRLDRVLRLVGDQRQQRLGQPRQVPQRDR